MATGFSLDHGITACTGVEVNILSDGTFALRALDLSLEKKQVHIEDKKEYAGSLAQITAIGLKGPVAITLTGKGVLIKKSAKLEQLSEQNLRNVFPGYSPAAFYVQHFVSGENSFIAFIRKEIADPLLEAFRKTGAAILLFSLGPFNLDHILPQLNNYNGDLSFDGHQVKLNENKAWLDYQYETGTGSAFALKIDIEVIPEQFLLAYSAAFQLLLNDRVELIAVEDDAIKQDLAELLAGIKFKKNGTLLLGILFCLLLINFMLFSFYNSANQQLAGQAGQRSSQFLDRQKLQSDSKEKETQVKLLGWNHGQTYAFLCDQLGQSLPAAINLSEININGLKDSYQLASKASPLETGSIRINGTSTSVYVINDWIYALQKRSWVKAVQLEKYGKDDQKGTEVFTLQINY